MAVNEAAFPSRVQLDALRHRFQGEIIGPHDAGYDEARRLWCAIFDQRPTLVVRPSSLADVQAAIRFGRERELPIAVRGGGHSAVGHSGPDGSLVIDLRALNAVSVDADRRLARVGGGALLGQLDVAAQAHGLVCPVGVVSHTGVGGLTLGAGVGRLQRHFGLTIDNLRSVELVSADGKVVRASETEEPELFWGIRGAGPNFGVVTAFEFELRPFAGTLHRHVRVYPASAAHDAWASFREYARIAPHAVSAIFWIGRAEPAAEFPESVGGKPIVMIATNHSGAAEDAERDLAPLMRGPEPVSVTSTDVPYLEIQGSSDLTLAWGSRSFILSGFVGDLSPATIAAFLEHAATAPPEASVSFTMQGGAIGRVDDDAMAYTGRPAPFDISADTNWTDLADDGANIRWVRDAMAIAADELLPGRYMNALSEAGPEITRQIYGDAKLERLRLIKKRWDPENVFHLNHNIAP